MGKLAKVVKVRVCINCKQQLTTDSKGLRKHFIQCCAKARQWAYGIGPGSLAGNDRDL